MGVCLRVLQLSVEQPKATLHKLARKRHIRFAVGDYALDNAQSNRLKAGAFEELADFFHGEEVTQRAVCALVGVGVVGRVITLAGRAAQLTVG